MAPGLDFGQVGALGVAEGGVLPGYGDAGSGYSFLQLASWALPRALLVSA